MSDTKDLKDLQVRLKSGEYDGVDIMSAEIAIDELIELRAFRENAFQAHPNIDTDIEHLP